MVETTRPCALGAARRRAGGEAPPGRGCELHSRATPTEAYRTSEIQPENHPCSLSRSTDHHEISVVNALGPSFERHLCKAPGPSRSRTPGPISVHFTVSIYCIDLQSRFTVSIYSRVPRTHFDRFDTARLLALLTQYTVLVPSCSLDIALRPSTSLCSSTTFYHSILPPPPARRQLFVPLCSAARLAQYLLAVLLLR